MKMKHIMVLLSSIILVISIFALGCGNNKEIETTITIAAASSLQNAMEEKIIPAFNTSYPNIKVQGTYDASGKLQTQIQEGARIDLFFSAALKQMDVLINGGYVKEEDVVKLLKNDIVLVGGLNESTTVFNNFSDICKANTIAMGDPEIVPAGQYGKECLIKLNLWNTVMSKTVSMGTNVSQVVGWIAEGSAEVGILYYSDAVAVPNQIRIISKAPAESVSECIYPVAVLSTSQEKKASNLFLEFLKSDESLRTFESYGLTIAEQ